MRHKHVDSTKATRKIAAALVGTALAAGLASCAKPAPAHRPAASGKQASAEAAPVITDAEARTLLSDVTRKNNQANAALDSTLLAEYEAESSYRIDDAVYRIGRVMDPQHKDPIKAFEYTEPVFSIPRLTAYPQWFLADAAMTGAKKRCVLVFSREAAGQPWKVVSQATLTDSVPALVKDAGGNAVVAPEADGAKLLAAPKDVAAAHAAYLTGGGSAPEAATFTPHKKSDEIINDDALRKQLLFVSRKTGKIAPAEKVTRNVTVEPYPVRALQTADGGALVAYVTKWQLTAEQPDGLTKLKGSDAALAGRTDFDEKITISWLTQWLVVVPPKAGGGKVTVVGADTGKESLV